MISRKKGIVALLSVSVAVSSVLAYYLLMPAWVIASRVDEGTRLFEGGLYEVADDDLARYPALREAMARADEADVDGSWVPPVSASYLEGRIMMEEYDMHFALEHAAILVYDDRHYHVQIVFDYERPMQL
jgi:hypothetical protein